MKIGLKTCILTVIFLSGIVASREEPERRAVKTHTICYGSWKAHEPYADFIASHYDMILDGERGIVEGLTRRNPKIGVLKYKIAQSMHDSYPDWKEVDANENWFIHAKGFEPVRENRLRSASYDEYMMDVSQTGWQDHYAKFVGQAMRENPLFAGIFADNCWSSFSSYAGKWYRIIPVEKHVTEGEKGEIIKVDFPVVKRRRGLTPIKICTNSKFEGPNFYDETKGCSWNKQTITLNSSNLPGPRGTEVWISYAAVCSPPDDLVTKWEDGITAIVTKAKAALPDKLLIGNSGSRLYCERYLDAMDGIFVEAFIHAPWGMGSRGLTATQWLEEVNALVHSQEKNKWHMSHSGTDPKNSTPEQTEQWRLFCYASFLLGTGPKATFQFVAETKDRAPNYYPEWDLLIGEPKGSYTTIKIGTTIVYQREFANGKAVVNPSDGSDTVTIDLGGTYRDWQGRVLKEIKLPPKHGTVVVVTRGQK
ncbi:MAG: putative glycoside hydrolase [Kiritimatiellae bacterium]|nr:putative glycoside hydrolase [Kiritimatiellia bacterium]MDD5521739.1 putative glycoside hydrolase [Kiritimatiellia bacterium]